MDRLDDEYNKWYEQQTFEVINKDDVREMLVKDLSFVSKLTVEEYTLYRKWLEIQERYPDKASKTGMDSFFGEATSDDSGYPDVQLVKNNIWTPVNHDDYIDLEPEVYHCKGPDVKIWSILRTFTSTMLNNSNIGRNLRFIVSDKRTGKYLGVICLSSDFLDLTPRDNFIGWSREIKTQGRMINHTGIGSTIVPTQPLGFSYVGGKLLALLTLSDVPEKTWNETYGDVLAGITTTSLYGSFSQYQNLKYWNKRGHSAGSIKFEPQKRTVLFARNWLRTNFPRRYWEWYNAKNEQGLPLKRDHKQRSLSFVYSQLKISKDLFQTDHARGIYFSHLYNNTNEFLRKEITEDKLVKRFDNSVDSLVDIWKNRYAVKRVASLLRSDRFNYDQLFYDFMIGRTWEEVKEKYINDVGR